MRTLVATPDPEWEKLAEQLTEELTDTQQLIVEVCDEIKQLLLTKNRKYGNSALKPVRIYSKADAREQLAVRIDDKINRLINRQSDEDEDVDIDFIGYLILLQVYDRLNIRKTL